MAGKVGLNRSEGGIQIHTLQVREKTEAEKKSSAIEKERKGFVRSSARAFTSRQASVPSSLPSSPPSASSLRAPLSTSSIGISRPVSPRTHTLSHSNVGRPHEHGLQHGHLWPLVVVLQPSLLLAYGHNFSPGRPGTHPPPSRGLTQRWQRPGRGQSGLEKAPGGGRLRRAPRQHSSFVLCPTATRRDSLALDGAERF